jgi:glutamate racemase
VAEKGNHHYFVTDVPAGFIRIGNRFLGGNLEDVHQVTVEENVAPEVIDAAA